MRKGNLLSMCAIVLLALMLSMEAGAQTRRRTTTVRRPAVRKTTTTVTQNRGKQRPKALSDLQTGFAKGFNPFGALPKLIDQYQMPLWNAYEGSTGQNKMYTGPTHGELAKEFIAKAKALEGSLSDAIIDTATDPDTGLALGSQFQVKGYQFSGTAGSYTEIAERVTISAKVASDNGTPHRNLALIVYSTQGEYYWPFNGGAADYTYDRDKGELYFFVKITACNAYIMSHIHHVLLTVTGSEACRDAVSRRNAMELDFTQKYMPRMF